MNTIFRRGGASLFLLLLLLSAATASAQAPAFLIERIEVRNLRRASPQVVKSESLLHEGQTYSERELQDAQSRIRRLPFVLDVDFSLEKGSQRDAYVLVMKVDEASPFFVGIDHVTYPPDEGRSTEHDTFMDVGFRWFVGDYGQLHATLGADLDDRPRTLAVGYTQYNLLGRSIFLSLTGSTDLLENVDSLGGSGVLGVPLRGNHALRLELSGYRTNHSELGVDADSRRVSGSLGWIYDTTNDALFPTEGMKLGAGVGRSRSEYTAFMIRFPDEVIASRETTSTATSLQLNGAKYWPLRDLDALVFSTQVSRTRASDGQVLFLPAQGTFVPVSSTTLGATAQVTYSGSFWGIDRTRRIGDLRYEAGVRGWTWRSELSGAGLPDRTYDEIGIVGGLAHRNRWGLVRFTVAWAVTSDSSSTVHP